MNRKVLSRYSDAAAGVSFTISPIPKEQSVQRIRLVGVLACYLVLLVWSPRAGAQPTQDESVTEKQRREAIEKNSETFRFGLSVGWRHVVGSQKSLMQDVSLNPLNGNVTVDPIDRGAVVLSGVVTAFPWRNNELSMTTVAVANTVAKRFASASAAWRWGFIANINVASFSQENVAAFNQSVEGGLGIAYKMSEDFSLAVTMERLKGRALRSFVEPGKPIVDSEGKKLATLAKTDDQYFRDDNLGALSLKFVYFFK